MIGERLRSIRKQNKMKQEDLAQILNVNGSAISRYESDKDTPSDAIKVKIAKHFNVSLDYLLGVIDQEVPYYREGVFVKLPDKISDQDIFLLTEIIDYINFKTTRNNA